MMVPLLHTSASVRNYDLWLKTVEGKEVGRDKGGVLIKTDVLGHWVGLAEVFGGIIQALRQL